MATNSYRTLPETPGVYLMKDAAGRVIYVGKAGNLRRRVSSYFSRAHDSRIEMLVREISKIDYRQTDSALEALILESRLIKELAPKFNVKEKDDKSFLYFEITNEKFPRVLFARGLSVKGHGSRVEGQRYYGPFTSAGSAREAYKILRRIFPWSTHNGSRVKGHGSREIKNSKRLYPEPTCGEPSRTSRRACFDYEIGLCPGTCINAVSRKEYMKNIARLKLFLKGKKARVMSALQKEMAAASKGLEFEKAEKLRRQLFALQHIHDTALIHDNEIENCKLSAEGGSASGGKIENSALRIEGYDISNISGTSAVGAMVVFSGTEPDKNEYRRFKIRAQKHSHILKNVRMFHGRRGANHDRKDHPLALAGGDIGMLREVLARRFRRIGAGAWPLSDLILVDGGVAQVAAARAIIRARGLRIPVVGIAKGPRRDRNDLVGTPPPWVDIKTLIRVRDEAHRFAISYHRRLRAAHSLL